MGINKINKFNYPSVVLLGMRLTVEALAKFNEVYSIFLIGSASRGELIIDNDGHVISDFEFFIITKNKIPRIKIDHMESEVKKISEQVKIKIDINVMSINQVRKLPRKFIVFDSSATGITLYGEHVGDLFPLVNASNIEMDDVDEIILYRYLEVFQNIEDRDKLVLSMLKNVLYLLTWAQIKDGNLISGFRNRVEMFQSSPGELTKSLFHKKEKLVEKSFEYRMYNDVSIDEETIGDLLELYSLVNEQIHDSGFKKFLTKNKIKYKVKYIIYAFQRGCIRELLRVISPQFDIRKSIINQIDVQLKNKILDIGTERKSQKNISMDEINNILEAIF
ncbi:hypothetical protein [Vibrio vulnificus]|uniref:hypothetical protein n=1 Tax=Vibrio vulnificus TaxID=672 RepID=UPI003D9C8B82